MSYSTPSVSFSDLYSHLAEEEESSAVNNFLQDLMEREVVDSGIVEDLVLDSEERDRRMRRDPSLTMEARHRQVQNQRDVTQDCTVSGFPRFLTKVENIVVSALGAKWKSQ